jgi:hypothetical protein
MDWTYKAVLTTVTVAAVLMASRWMGRRFAGLLAGLPVITVPALMWVAQEQGTDFAVHSAVGSAAACAMAPLFAASFVLLAPHVGAAISLAGAVLVAWAAVHLLLGLAGQPGLALVAAAVSCALVQWLLRRLVRPGWRQGQDPGAGNTGSPARALRALAGEPWLTAGLAGLVSASISVLATTVGPYWSGVLSTLPLVSACALVHLQRTYGPSALPGFVSGYVIGVLAKALFVCSFAWFAPQWGVAPALALAVLVGSAGAVTLTRWRRRDSTVATRVAAPAVRSRKLVKP